MRYAGSTPSGNWLLTQVRKTRLATKRYENALDPIVDRIHLLDEVLLGRERKNVSSSAGGELDSERTS
jgi:hypothetical protein